MDEREATDTPQEYPKSLYRGGQAYDETTGRGVAREHMVVVKDADEEREAKRGGFAPYEPPKPNKKEQAAQDAAELPREVQPTGEGAEPNSLRRAIDHLDAQGRPADDRGGDHSADAANKTGTVDVSRSEAPAGGDTSAGAVEAYHSQVAEYEQGAGAPRVTGGTPTPAPIATVIVDGKPDLTGQDGNREGKVQTDDLDRLDPSKHLRPDGIVLPPGGDPAHQNAVEDHGDPAHPGGAPAGKSVDPGKPKAGKR